MSYNVSISGYYVIFCFLQFWKPWCCNNLYLPWYHFLYGVEFWHYFQVILSDLWLAYPFVIPYHNDRLLQKSILSSQMNAFILLLIAYFSVAFWSLCTGITIGTANHRVCTLFSGIFNNRDDKDWNEKSKIFTSTQIPCMENCFTHN